MSVAYSETGPPKRTASHYSMAAIRRPVSTEVRRRPDASVRDGQAGGRLPPARAPSDSGPVPSRTPRADRCHGRPHPQDHGHPATAGTTSPPGAQEAAKSRKRKQRPGDKARKARRHERRAILRQELSGATSPAPVHAPAQVRPEQTTAHELPSTLDQNSLPSPISTTQQPLEPQQHTSPPHDASREPRGRREPPPSAAHTLFSDYPTIM